MAFPAPISAYAFADGTDATGNGYNLTATGSPVDPSGHTGSGARATVGNYFQGPVGPNTSQANWTIMAWFKVSAYTPTYRAITSNNGNLYLEVTQLNGGGAHLALECWAGSSPHPQVYLWSNVTDTNLPWIHAAVTRTSDGVCTLYINGVAGTGDGNGNPATGLAMNFSNTFRAGGAPGNDSYSLDGVVDDLRFFDVALTGAEITEAMNTPVGASTVTKTVASTWNTRARVTKTVASTWNTRAQVTKTVASTWNVAALGPSPVGTPTLVENAASATVAVTVPSGVVTGELLLCAVTGSRTATGDTLTAPAGWQTAAVVKDSSTNGVVSGLYWRIATGSETSTYTWTNTAGTAGRIAGAMQRISGADTTTPLDVAATSVALAAVAGTTVDAPTLTTVSANTLLVSVGAANASSTATLTVPSGMTLINTTTGTGRRQSWATQANPTAGATGVRTWTVSTASLQRSAILAAIRPAGSVVTPTLTSRLVGVTGRVRTFTSDATSVRLKVGSNTAVTTGVTYSSAQTPDSIGGTTHDLSALAPGVWYYRVAMTDAAASESLDSASTVGRIVIAPTGQTSFAFCFSSCCNASDSTAMAAIAARQDDLFIHVGDLWYADATGVNVANYRTQMSSKITAPNHAAVFATIPSAYSASDHDFGMNNNAVGTVNTTAVAPFNQVYREQWPNPTVQTTTGTYHTFSWGRVRFIIMDARTFKSDPAATDNSSKTVLGSTQKQWVKDTVTAATEPVIVMVTDIPWTGATTAGEDDWGGFDTERQELASYLVASGKRVVFIGGDMHAVAHSSGTGTSQGIPGYGASPLNNNASLKATPWDQVYPASGSAVVQQYGRVAVADTGATITLTFTGYSADNTARVSRTDTFNLTVTKTVVSTWAVRSQVLKTAAASAWAVRSRVTKALASSWAVRLQTIKTAASTWNVGSLAGTVLKLVPSTWAVRSRVTKTAVSSWGVRFTRAKTVAAAWAVRTRVQRTYTVSWRVRRAVVKTVVSTWSTRMSRIRTVASQWSTFSDIVITIEPSWPIRLGRGRRGRRGDDGIRIRRSSR